MEEDNFIKEEDIIKPNNPQHNSIMVLKALMNGQKVKFKEEGFEHFLAQTEEGSYRLMMNDKHGNILGTHITLEQFIKMTSDMSDDQITILAANNVLNDINKKER